MVEDDRRDIPFEESQPIEPIKTTLIAYILLEKDGKILLSKRTSRSRLGGKWSLPAGHIEKGETPIQTASREAREELGIDIDESDLTSIHELRLKDPDGQRVGFIVKAGSWKGEPRNMEPDKCAALMWADPHNLPRNTGRHIILALSHMRIGKKLTEYDFTHPQRQSSRR